MAWLAAGLAIIAIASAAIARRLRLRLLRREKAMQLLDSLATYTEWIAMQGRAAYFQGAADVDSPLQSMRNIQFEWFPELSEETTRVFEWHARLIDFLWAQQMLRLSDGEAWLESDHDERFLQLWRAHREAVEAMAETLTEISGAPEPEMELTNREQHRWLPPMRKPGSRGFRQPDPIR